MNIHASPALSDAEEVRMSLLDATIAAQRFGLGARPGELEAIAHDPKGWLLAQLEGEDDFAALDGLPSSASRITELMLLSRAPSVARPLTTMRHRALASEEGEARMRLFVETDMPFRARWLAAWSNHFTVSARHRLVRSGAAVFERTVVRPHCTGRFADMLQASTSHPAMLAYLDNAMSVGPRSPAGRSGRRGLNENLAREVLELHTLGADGGYTQADVLGLAKLLTGWTFMGRRRSTNGQFRFESSRHEPGPHTLLGRAYPAGLEGGRRALADLAQHPATAVNVCTRLARHFLADDPPSAVTASMAEAFRAHDGDLVEVAKAMVNHPASWSPALGKLRTPHELVVATARATGHPTRTESLLHGLRDMGQQPFATQSPAGWSDLDADWAGPGAVMARLDWVRRLATRVGRRIDAPVALAEQVSGPWLDAMTRSRLAAASSSEDALALWLASPAFQRR
jgi:uncharacterized protein (DUF1800 family)